MTMRTRSVHTRFSRTRYSHTRFSRSTLAPSALLGLGLLALTAHAAQAQNYTLTDKGDTLTVNNSGTSGTVGGQPVSQPSQTDINGNVTISSPATDASVNIGPGGAITNSSGDGVDNLGNLTDVVRITGGSVTSGIDTYGIGNLGTLDLSGGTVASGSGSDGILNDGLVNFSGGTVTGGFTDLANNGGTVNFFGTGFEINGQSVTGPYTTPVISSGTLTGMLADGQKLDLHFVNSGTLTFNAPTAPEPSGLTLVGMMALPLAGLLLRARRKNTA